MKRGLLIVASLLAVQVVSAQIASDSVTVLNEVNVRAYFRKQPVLTSPSSVGILQSADLRKFSPAYLIPALNTVPGVRMEERSPGSYRLSIRGSLLRSPFGIRNVKIYADDFMLTDAGGNTYLNLVDFAGVGGIELLKGPEGSVFGANTGGVVLLTTDLSAPQPALNAEVTAGSFGLFRENVSLNRAGKKYQVDFTQALQRADGYRRNSAMSRQYYSLRQAFAYAPNASLRSLVFYSDLDYETPGGLTLAQLSADPRAARPATPTIPGAVEQRAGIRNKTFFAGIAHELEIAAPLRWITALSLMHTDFVNPFITNYEERRENSYGLRSYIDYSSAPARFTWKSVAGLEMQQTNSDIDNSANNRGLKGALTVSDALQARQGFGFVYLQGKAGDRFIAEIAASLNDYGYTYRSRFPVATTERRRHFAKQVLPRAALSYKVAKTFAVRASAAKGYSAPAIAEVRASDNIINTGLQAEHGWNFEAGARLKSRRMYLDLALFNFRLNEAIVRRVNPADAEFFVNAGGTSQTGLEAEVRGWLIEPGAAGWITALETAGAYTWSPFKFRNYTSGSTDLSGKRLTGVPLRTWLISARAAVRGGVDLFVQHSFVSSIPLNDANLVFAKAYPLFQCQAGWELPRRRMPLIRIFAGADNVFNVKYSLGNDLNAAGNRYFNAAPGRNYYAGLRIGGRK